MNRAAPELNTVQSNVTTRIRSLEQELGTALFNRHSRGVTLTAAGRRLLPYAARVRHLLDEACRAVEGAFVCAPVEHPELEQETIFHEELVVATAPNVTTLAALEGKGELKIVVLRAGCSYRQRLEESLARRGIVGLRQLEFGTIEAIVGCVAAGLGVTLLPRGVIEPARREGRIAVHELPPAEAGAETIFIRRGDVVLSSALAAFLDCARPALVDAAAAE